MITWANPGRLPAPEAARVSAMLNVLSAAADKQVRYVQIKGRAASLVPGRFHD